MGRRQRTALLVAGIVSLLVVVAAGLSRVSVGGAPCGDRVAVAALRSPTSGDPVRDACTRASQDRGYAVLASLMGLVLISGLLSRERP
ncbi:MAG: hypothetical protein JWN08_1833 [Frankiales bacterium]|nr:hypothetical protein [Frankiales bacterium]